MADARPPEEAARLEAEIAELRTQIKILVRTESKLNSAQQRLDEQITLFRRLYELGQHSNATFDLSAVLRELVTFAVNELGYQRSVALVARRAEAGTVEVANGGAFANAEQSGEFVVKASDGYYEDSWPPRLAAVSIPAEDPVFVRAHASKRFVHPDDRDAAGCATVSDSLGVDHFLVFPLYASGDRLVGMLVAGSTRDQEQFFAKVEEEGDAAYGLAHLAAIASAALNKCFLFQQLSEERNLLDERVRARTRELSDAYANLETLTNLKSLFFANVSHELRTPLTLSIGPLELLLRESGLPADMRRPLRSIYNNQLRLQELISDLLDLSKLEAGKMTLQLAREDLAEILRFCVSTLDAAAAARRIALRTDIPRSGVFVNVDCDKLEKIVMNLLSNAFKFTKDGGTIAVRLEELGDDVRVSVSDTGIGIPEAERARIFDRFYQVHGSDTRAFVGTGIGLSMVRELTELHGGTVMVDSEVGVGTTFTITLPACRVQADDDEAAVPSSDGARGTRRYRRLAGPDALHAPAEAERVVGGSAMTERGPTASATFADPRGTVLVVDDSPEMREFVAKVLRPHFSVVDAFDGQDGLEKARRLLPDIIVSDVMMPRMSGKELCAAVKASDGPLGRTPVVLVTAKAEMSMKIEGLSLGADDYLVKPFNVDELVCRTKNLVTVRRQERELLRAHEELKERERRVREDLEEARAFQQRLLPDLPVSRALAFSAVYRPVDLVGGDIYDLIELAPGRFRLFLADATGHGVQASLRTVMLKAEFERVQRALDDPSKALAALHKRLVGGYALLELLCTACCMDVEVLPTGGALVRCASAGSPPLLHASRRGCVEVPTGGPFLGAPTATIDVPCVEIRLAPGDRLTVFTDGLCDQTAPSGGIFDLRHAALALAPSTTRLDAAVKSIMVDFDAFLDGAPATDDVTLLALECVGHA